MSSHTLNSACMKESVVSWYLFIFEKITVAFRLMTSGGRCCETEREPVCIQSDKHEKQTK